ncbi:hypothetical protein BHE74_00004605 [Ensete ventricosum]|nr:hypothetical protein GW17_00040520 [Ensete ventricosum]RWW86610.1 hypothetical protein BHE74_00004605 [Ensete ventricosum]RZR87291.1 hypothetical protein BHM03_00014653 [Ensete ventricosum]
MTSSSAASRKVVVLLFFRFLHRSLKSWWNGKSTPRPVSSTRSPITSKGWGLVFISPSSCLDPPLDSFFSFFPLKVGDRGDRSAWHAVCQREVPAAGRFPGALSHGSSTGKEIVGSSWSFFCILRLFIRTSIATGTYV